MKPDESSLYDAYIEQVKTIVESFGGEYWFEQKTLFNLAAHGNRIESLILNFRIGKLI